MKTLRSFAALATLLVSSLALHASSSDALAVLQQCGRPLSDVTTQGSPEYPGPQRVLTYQSASLHFQQSAGGWNFIFANPTHSSRMRDRAQTGVLLPCFDEAMSKVQLYAPLRAIQQPAAPEKLTFAQWMMKPMHGLRPAAMLVLLLLYILPTIIGAVRRAPQLRRLIAINLLLGWTLVGWGYALLLSNEDPADHVDLEGEVGIPALRPASDVLSLNLLDGVEQEEAVFVPYRGRSQRAGVPSPALVPAAEEKTASSEKIPERTRPLSFAFASATPKAVTPEPSIRWIDFFPRRRPCRIDVVSSSSEVTVYDIEITQRGIDPLGREVIGGYVGKTFMAFPVEKIAHLRELAA